MFLVTPNVRHEGQLEGVARKLSPRWKGWASRFVAHQLDLKIAAYRTRIALERCE